MVETLQKSHLVEKTMQSAALPQRLDNFTESMSRRIRL